ncbi:ComEA family DNA-binding protein [Cellulomonas edaphi]|uniref:ComEA family DNA-binding protein n=1 Tax=Cellulomonas edaphi TaxID=3053468 RepID=A0ABT7S7G3_9CELL|nr:ComEA family DNA-binding protein [Cellulomons edaphi]MDM7831568.1 ComEA family DNA-binding protein [Cellulomons edaphi]
MPPAPAWVPAVPGPEGAWGEDGAFGPDARPVAAEPATSAALRRVRGEYAAQHGHPLDHAPPARHRLRWAVTGRAAGVAVLALAIVGGAVAIRAASVSAGPAVVLPIPSPEGTTGCLTPCSRPPTAAATTPAASAAPATAVVVVVHVVGAVRHHGIVRLPTGSRVGDAVDAAGGATSRADLDGLNLARVLVDGEQIVVPREGQVPVAPAPAPGAGPPADPASPSSGAAQPVDVNTADAAALDALPGIGPVLAQRIVDYRAEHPFTSVDELEDVPGIGPAVLERLRDLVRV